MIVSWMPGVVSSTRVTIGRRWLVTITSPTAGHRCRLQTRDAHVFAQVVCVERPEIDHLGAVGVDQLEALTGAEPCSLAVAGADSHAFGCSHRRLLVTQDCVAGTGLPALALVTLVPTKEPLKKSVAPCLKRFGLREI